jgi:hypothetical protein
MSMSSAAGLMCSWQFGVCAVYCRSTWRKSLLCWVLSGYQAVTADLHAAKCSYTALLTFPDTLCCAIGTIRLDAALSCCCLRMCYHECGSTHRPCVSLCTFKFVNFVVSLTGRAQAAGVDANSVQQEACPTLQRVILPCS